MIDKVIKYIIKLINSDDASIRYIHHDYLTMYKNKALQFNSIDEAQKVVDRIKLHSDHFYLIEEV